MFGKRVTIIVGHFGSGKTEIAVNGALKLAKEGIPVALVDLDVVKPYFRSRAAQAAMAEVGVDVVVPNGENLFADLPIIVPRIRSLLRESQRKVLFDVGGDDTGARAVGSLADVVPHGETDHLLVLNFRRPFTETVDAAAAMIREIEVAARLPITGLVSNTHLMGETSAELVAEGYRLACETGDRVGVPVVAIAMEKAIAALLDRMSFACPVLELERQIRPLFDGTRQQRTARPLMALP